ncbi:unnamed protein product [Didymodactylos carnosus]|uniref:Carboxypeptidase n=1 Tax=Didymodactylos carnosus TaxID=1234261 RepID=A0A814EYM8_9BILA|nr:unnamed protein product [Didymodactylos carnosus]CAF0975645.1 unnamed protein product [Didymodactylos carnosus]CAF3656940.1 unnamed protein product [Didymodactylos carnosus]CAF3748503.1 unnamed protein product [Didymodactylos carnosus]
MLCILATLCWYFVAVSGRGPATLSGQKPLRPHEQVLTPAAKAELRSLQRQQKTINSKSLTGYTSNAQADYIQSLPGISSSNINFRQFSGYLNVSTKKHIFYWFIESQRMPATDPVIWWSNGGPGCSGLIGMLEEFGPFRVQPDNKTLLINPYSWNRLANILFVESPVGVGFSYSDAPNEDYLAWNDSQSAQDNYFAVLSYFAKFPQYRKNDFYLSAESYGGHYVPQLAKEIVDRNAKLNASDVNKINLKALLIGNPLNDPFSQEYAGNDQAYWGHSLIDSPTWQGIVKYCIEPFEKNPYNSSTGKGYQPWANADCVFFDNRASFLTAPQYTDSNANPTGLDPYGLDYSYCSSAQQQRETLWYFKHRGSAANDDSDVVFRPCINSYTIAYLSSSKVQKALHVQSSKIPPYGTRTDKSSGWYDCSRMVGQNYNSTNYYLDITPVYTYLIKKLPQLKILVFSGDDDGVCATVGSQYWMYAMNLTVTSAFQPWYDYFEPDQFGGYFVKFKGIALATIHGAGHEVAYYSPQRAYGFFKYVLDGKFWP